MAARVFKEESTASLSRELGLAYNAVQHLRQQLHQRAQRLQAQSPLPDAVTETDETFQNAGKKGDEPIIQTRQAHDDC